ncbi:MAG: hypothetical protein ABIC04_08980 [Nanoarchaeota archaeon]
MKWHIFACILIVICSSSVSGLYKTYIIDEKSGLPSAKFLTFNIAHDVTEKEELTGLFKKTSDKRISNYQYAQDEETFARCMKKITKNWKRNIAQDGTVESKYVTGYNAELDKSYEREIWFSIRRGDKAC